MTRVKASRHFDSGVGVIGAVVALCALTLQVAHASTFESFYLLAVPLIMVMGWFPMLVGRQGGGIEIGLDTCILIFLGTIAQPETALVVWSLGVTLGQVLSEKKRSTQIFNSALGVTAGGLAILVLELTRSGAPTSPRELLAAGLAGVVYFVVDFVVSAISLVIDDESKFREAFSPSRAKDDPTDAEYLVELLVHHRERLKAWLPDDEKTRTLQLLVEHRRRLVGDQTRISNRLTALLKGYLPQVLAWFPDIRTALVCDFLLKWPSLDALKGGIPSVTRRDIGGEVWKCFTDSSSAHRMPLP